MQDAFLYIVGGMLCGGSAGWTVACLFRTPARADVDFAWYARALLSDFSFYAEEAARFRAAAREPEPSHTLDVTI